MSNLEKRIEILKGFELKKTISRLTFEILEKVNNLDNLLLLGIPTRGVYLSEVLTKDMQNKTGIKIKKGIIDPTLHRDDQSKIGTRLIQATDIPLSIENKEIIKTIFVPDRLINFVVK